MLTVNADDLPRVMNCQGSLQMPEAFPAINLDTTIRDEGIAAHYMANAVFRGTHILANLIDKKAPNGVYMSADMATHVSEYLSALDCGETEANTSFGNDTYRVAARCDHYRYDAATNTLTIDDLKYGYGIVEPDENWTLLAHAIGVCWSLQIQPATIILRIHQPRPHHRHGKLREWRTTWDNLMLYAAQIERTLTNPDNILATGDDWCRKCRALASCPAAHLANMNAVDASAIALSDELPPDALAYELDLLTTASATLKSRLDALTEMVMYKRSQGILVGNYHAEQGIGNTTWKPGLNPQIVTAVTGVPLTTAPGFVTPAEAKRRGVPEHVIKSLTYRPRTALKLIKEDANKRASRLLSTKGN